MKRRLFLKATSASAVGMAMGIDYSQTVHAAVAKDADKPIPRRRSKKGIKLSIVGFGGIVVVGQAQSDANDEVARAVNEGSIISM